MSMSIEGAFFKAALDLGLGSELVDTEVIKTGGTPDFTQPFYVRKLEPDEDLNASFELIGVMYKATWYRASIPNEVYKYLGIKTLVTATDLQRFSLVNDININEDFLLNKRTPNPKVKVNGYKWGDLNDQTNLTLTQLINLAIYTLSKSRRQK